MSCDRVSEVNLSLTRRQVNNPQSRNAVQTWCIDGAQWSPRCDAWIHKHFLPGGADKLQCIECNTFDEHDSPKENYFEHWARGERICLNELEYAKYKQCS